mgnify:CR=1 FL=1
MSSDEHRDRLLRRNAHCFSILLITLFSISVFVGQTLAIMFALFVVPVYALYYATAYIVIARRFEDSIKRLDAFGIKSKTSYTGIYFHLAILVVFSGVYLVFAKLV